MTQEQLARLLGVHTLTVSKWERGQTAPSAHQVALLQAALKATKRTPDIGQIVQSALIGAGLGVALFLLLKAAFEEGGS